MVTRLKNGLEILKATTQSRGGQCLSDEYKGVDSKYLFRCAHGHEWETTYYLLVSRMHWCPRCAHKTVDTEFKQEQLQKAKGLGRVKGGECLESEYHSSKQQMRWRCAQNHEWLGSFSNIVSRGKWCPWCAGNKSDPLSRLKLANAYAISRGGKCLSTDYTSNKASMDWECVNGHTWQAAYGTVVGRNVWCAICVGTQRIPEEQLANAQEVARSKGGECLEVSYISNSEPMLWQCNRGHKWRAPYYSIVQSGSWCQICSSGLKERIARNALEQLFDIPFPKARPDWLRNPKTGRKLEIDGYNEGLGLAFEYHGPQHYRVVLPFKMNIEKLDASRYRDQLKISLCHEHGIEIIEIPFQIESHKMLGWLAAHISETPELSRFRPLMRDWQKLKPTDWTESEHYSIHDLIALAKSKGGQCLSNSYLGATAKHVWICKEGHEWESSWDSIKNADTWCPVCCGNVILNPLLELQEIAKAKGGKCLSTEYLGSRVKLRFRCAIGHEWNAAPTHIRCSGSWCPWCRGSKRLA